MADSCLHMQGLGLALSRYQHSFAIVRPQMLLAAGSTPLLHPTSLFNYSQRRPIVSRAAKEIAKRPTLASKAAARFPKFMGKYGSSLIGAPVSHITAFLLVHELTAIIPLFGLWYLFNVFDYMPTGIPDWVFGAGEDFIRKIGERNHWDWIAHADKGSKVLLHGVAAYAAVKATLPLRILFSLWVMPWTATRVVQPVSGFFSRIIGLRKPKAKEGELPDNLKQKKQPPLDK